MNYAPMINDCHEWFAWMDASLLLNWDYPSYSETIERDIEIAGLTLLF